MDGNTLSWLSWVIVGGAAGWLASQVMKSRLGLGIDIVVGIVGAALTGFVLNANAIGTSSKTGFDIWSIVMAFIGAVALLGLLRLISNQSISPDSGN